LHDPFPHPHPSIRFLDNLVLIVGILGPLMAIPQILNIYINHDATGVSGITWGSFALFNIIWIAYGYVHKAKPVLVAYILWFIVNSTVAIGTLIY
jgi:uncharacterized protein with PQ loop repeat